MHNDKNNFKDICKNLDLVLDEYILLNHQSNENDLDAAIKIKASSPSIFYLLTRLIDRVAHIHNISIEKTLSILAGACDILQKNDHE